MSSDRIDMKLNKVTSGTYSAPFVMLAVCIYLSTQSPIETYLHLINLHITASHITLLFLDHHTSAKILLVNISFSYLKATRLVGETAGGNSTFLIFFLLLENKQQRDIVVLNNKTLKNTLEIH